MESSFIVIPDQHEIRGDAIPRAPNCQYLRNLYVMNCWRVHFQQTITLELQSFPQLHLLLARLS